MALVYSTETGRLCDGCEQPIDQCCCKPASAPEGDGTVRVQREKKGRGGKTVTILSGIEGDKKVLSDLCKKLKKRFGSGGAVKNWTIELQGDLAEQSVKYLQELGFKAKQSGG
ncbi:stress response translation initiation inhibitor YciH (plasmid) [Bermanella sp. WJH001]|uniref:stress response translation initiation inhibitor YciH n=1 Tax=Bermanella sp. WJH001 TaxID=3048005 RepID=UPI0024BE16DB|nr:stress response translation initiation inhibitor YciH [Bermanella sp. WJH001]MDJ1539491.1 stress response translation initiation inhibitor YciH [Bermanella sp. WJH001]